jgi:hypothetical protein
MGILELHSWQEFFAYDHYEQGEEMVGRIG